MAKKKSSTTKRTSLKSPSGNYYAKRTAKGRFKDLDAVGASQRTDRRKSAKKKVKAGYGDQGDQRRRRRKGSKKR